MDELRFSACNGDYDNNQIRLKLNKQSRSSILENSLELSERDYTERNGSRSFHALPLFMKA